LRIAKDKGGFTSDAPAATAVGAVAETAVILSMVAAMVFPPAIVVMAGAQAMEVAAHESGAGKGVYMMEPSPFKHSALTAALEGKRVDIAEALVDEINSTAGAEGARLSAALADGLGCEDEACTNLASRGAFGVVRLEPVYLRFSTPAQRDDKPLEENDLVRFTVVQRVNFLDAGTGNRWYAGDNGQRTAWRKPEYRTKVERVFSRGLATLPLREWYANDGQALRQGLAEARDWIGRDIAAHVSGENSVFRDYFQAQGR
jgi:hypothetical protein